MRQYILTSTINVYSYTIKKTFFPLKKTNLSSIDMQKCPYMFGTIGYSKAWFTEKQPVTKPESPLQNTLFDMLTWQQETQWQRLDSGILKISDITNRHISVIYQQCDNIFNIWYILYYCTKKRYLGKAISVNGIESLRRKRGALVVAKFTIQAEKNCVRLFITHSRRNHAERRKDNWLSRKNHMTVISTNVNWRLFVNAATQYHNPQSSISFRAPHTI